MSSDYMFPPSDETNEAEPVVLGGSLKILSVDDEASVHDVTKLVLANFKFEGSHPHIAIAMSAKEACQYMREHDDVALVLLDVVMESDHAGFEVVSTIRDELKNHRARIVIRTGQPGQMGMETTMAKYEVDGYVEKSSLTHNCLHATVYSALRAYKDSDDLDVNRDAQADFIQKIQQLNEVRDISVLYQHVAADINAFLPGVESIRVIINHKQDENIQVMDLSPANTRPETGGDEAFNKFLSAACEENATVQIHNQILFRHDLNNDEIFQLYVKTQQDLSSNIKSMFVAYAANVSTLYELGQVAA